MNPMQRSAAPSQAAIEAKNQMKAGFAKKGIMVATFSGIAYGLYTAFMTWGMSMGAWADWYGANTAGLSAFIIIYALGALGSAVNDTCSGVYTLMEASARGQLGDYFKTLKSKPGLVMVIAALIGGPIASTAYVVSIQMAGSIVIPISALCPAIGAILGKVLFKQPLTPRMLAGIAICFGASAMIGLQGGLGDAPDGLLLGCAIAFIAALGWGFEGCVGGYGTTLIDYKIGITIRQTTSGLFNLFVLFPILCFMAGDIGLAPTLAIQAFTSVPSILAIAVGGIFAALSFACWYKGAGMCGAALGMALNGAFAFWGPFFCWLVIGVVGGQEGWALGPIAWAAALIMIFGIFMIAMNPLDLFRKKEAE